MPSGRFGANSAWILYAAIAHNLLHAAGTLAGNPHRVARGATLRRRIITVPARLARPARDPAPTAALALGVGMAATMATHHRPGPTDHRLTLPKCHNGPTNATVEKLGRPASSPRTTHPTRSHPVISNHPRSSLTAGPRIQAKGGTGVPEWVSAPEAADRTMEVMTPQPGQGCGWRSVSGCRDPGRAWRCDYH
jgi:hypothetical protein